MATLVVILIVIFWLSQLDEATMRVQRLRRARKIQVALYLDRGDVEALKKLSLRTNLPQQAYLREGTVYVLKKYGALSGGGTKK